MMFRKLKIAQRYVGSLFSVFFNGQRLSIKLLFDRQIFPGDASLPKNVSTFIGDFGIWPSR